MNYAEWLRVRNCLRIVAVVLVILLLLAIILRVSVSRYMSPEAWISHMVVDPGTNVTHSVLPDGTKRVLIDDVPKHTHVVIDDHGYRGKHIVITEPTKHHGEHSHLNVGSIQVSETKGPNGITTTVIDTNGSVPFLYYMALADLVALIVATILAAPLAREIDGHLEVALTKPIPRARYALGAVVADVAGIVAASFLTVVAFFICQMLFEPARLDFSGVNARAIAMGVAMPLAWYALLCAATSWASRGYGAVLGFAWPVTILIAVLSAINPSNAVGLFVHDVAWVLSRLIPLSYVSFAGPNDEGLLSYGGANGGADFPMRLSIVALLFIVYISLAVYKWQRVEA